MNPTKSPAELQAEGVAAGLAFGGIAIGLGLAVLGFGGCAAATEVASAWRDVAGVVQPAAPEPEETDR